MRESRNTTSPDEEREALKDVRWPTVMVDSWQFGSLPVHERLRQLALGYLQSAKSLCVELGENPELLNWPRASVVCYSFFHSIELFLKACILFRVPFIEKCSHDISALKDKYLEIYPESAFYFQTPWDLNIEDVEELLGGKAEREDFESKKGVFISRGTSGVAESVGVCCHSFASSDILVSGGSDDYDYNCSAR